MNTLLLIEMIEEMLVTDKLMDDDKLLSIQNIVNYARKELLPQYRIARFGTTTYISMSGDQDQADRAARKAYLDSLDSY